MDTSNPICRCLADLLVSHGVRRAVVSPGSRNAPLLIALAAREEIELVTVIDERSAAFVALGLSTISDEPVALVCTSGTAMLNYAPAVAEAFYRKAPLIVVSADRPMEWIDQDDSQTLRQYEALANYVKCSYNIPDYHDENGLWYANRNINDALIEATTGRRAPIHINIQLKEPLGTTVERQPSCERQIEAVTAKDTLSHEVVTRLAEQIDRSAKVMIICGFSQPDSLLQESLKRLTAARTNIVVLTETISNLHGKEFIPDIDTTLSAMSDEEIKELRPEIVITTGGALVSRYVKRYLRRERPAEHWHVSYSHTTIDCFQCLTKRIETSAGEFFDQIAKTIKPQKAESEYFHRWDTIKNRAWALHQSYTAKAPWSDMKAFAVMMPKIGKRWNVQLSNGTPIRYAQLFGMFAPRRSDCNRGVSGIDGCTSTAVGASMAYDDITLLITGDMSASYDIGALALRQVTPKFKMVVINNSGGGIFRFIESTRNAEERERLFCVPPKLPLKELATAYGFSFHEASDEATLRTAFDAFVAESEHPAILEIHTPAEISAETLIGYFKYLNNK